MIDLHADVVESDEEPPELTDSDDSDVSGCNGELHDYALRRKVCTESEINLSFTQFLH